MTRATDIKKKFINGTIIEKKKLLKRKCVSIFSTAVVHPFFILRRTEGDMIIYVYWR